MRPWNQHLGIDPQPITDHRKPPIRYSSHGLHNGWIALTGRGDKGLLITTGTFTAEAKAEASRAGAPPIDLIDGYELCDLLQKYSLGITTTQRVIEEVEVHPGFFLDL